MTKFTKRMGDTILDGPGLVSLISILLRIETFVVVVMIIVSFCIWSMDISIVRFIICVIAQWGLLYIYYRKHPESNNY